MASAGRKLELDFGVPLGAGGKLPVTLRVQQQDRLAALQRQVLCQVWSTFGQKYDVAKYLLDGLASVEVEVDEGGEQARGDQHQQSLQQTTLQHFLINYSSQTLGLCPLKTKVKPGGQGRQQS